MSTRSDAAKTTDNELLTRFVRNHDQTAFRHLVERHASLVMGVCRQVSRNEQDAEDAFQATLLILARRGRRLCHVTSLGGWLHRVAYRTSLRGLIQRSRRREESLVKEPLNEQSDVLEVIHLREVRRLLHEEIRELPTRYREVLVLCDLERQTRAQAANYLHTTESAVKAALARGRRQLRFRLLRRGVVMSTAVAVARESFASADVSSNLVAKTVELCLADAKSGSQGISNPLESLTGRVDMMMSTSRSVALTGFVTAICVIPLLALAHPFGFATSTVTTVGDLREGRSSFEHGNSARVPMLLSVLEERSEVTSAATNRSLVSENTAGVDSVVWSAMPIATIELPRTSRVKTSRVRHSADGTITFQHSDASVRLTRRDDHLMLVSFRKDGSVNRIMLHPAATLKSYKRGSIATIELPKTSRVRHSADGTITFQHGDASVRLTRRDDHSMLVSFRKDGSVNRIMLHPAATLKNPLPQSSRRGPAA